jgi:hypothetical protein
MTQYDTHTEKTKQHNEDLHIHKYTVRYTHTTKTYEHTDDLYIRTHTRTQYDVKLMRGTAEYFQVCVCVCARARARVRDDDDAEGNQRFLLHFFFFGIDS